MQSLGTPIMVHAIAMRQIVQSVSRPYSSRPMFDYSAVLCWNSTRLSGATNSTHRLLENAKGLAGKIWESLGLVLELSRNLGDPESCFGVLREFAWIPEIVLELCEDLWVPGVVLEIFPELGIPGLVLEFSKSFGLPGFENSPKVSKSQESFRSF